MIEHVNSIWQTFSIHGTFALKSVALHLYEQGVHYTLMQNSKFLSQIIYNLVEMLEYFGA